jgi:hypothetical protein
MVGRAFESLLHGIECKERLTGMKKALSVFQEPGHGWTDFVCHGLRSRRLIAPDEIPSGPDVADRLSGS